MWKLNPELETRLTSSCFDFCVLPSNAEFIDLVSALLTQQINQYKVYASNEKPVLGVPDM